MDYVPSKMNIAATEDWIDQLGLRAIRTSDCVQRLKRVCLLGTMQYVVNLEHNYSRYEHSLGVARLAYEYARHWGLSEESQIKVVLVALLHDVGHLPFSHASEVFYRTLCGRYHTGHGSRLIRHLVRTLHLEGREAEAMKVDQVAHLVAHSHEPKALGLTRSDEGHCIRDVFHGVLSADTLDGITRAAESTGIDLPEPLEIIHSTFLQGRNVLIEGNGRALVERFLAAKHRIYHDYIYCSKGLASEAMLTRALELAFEGMSDVGEFLALDDEDTLDRLRGNEIARWILQKLESKDLFCSLRDVHADKYDLVVDMHDRLMSSGTGSAALRRELEHQFAKQMGLPHEDSFIIHPIIKLNFNRPGGSQLLLPSMPHRLRDIAGSYATVKSFGTTVGVVFPNEYEANTGFLTTLQPRTVLARAAARAAASPKGEHLEKHTGAYMTPPAIAEVMVDWAIRDRGDRALDPASGDGVFLQAAYRRLRQLGVQPAGATEAVLGVEAALEHCTQSIRNWPDEAAPNKPNVRNQDFLALLSRSDRQLPRVNAVVGNPPYIRADRLSPGAADLGTRLAGESGVRLSKLASSWASYLICATKLLRPGGRLAMVLPAELLTTAYAQPVREFLERRFRSLTIVLFEKAIFGLVQQDVLLLLASDDIPYGLRRLEVRDAKGLTLTAIAKADHVSASTSWLGGKWSHLISRPKIINLLSGLIRCDRVCEFGELASIRLGQVTGKNSFFLLDRDTVDRYAIRAEWLVHMVAKASALEGVIFTQHDRRRSELEGERCLALAIPSSSNINRDKGLLQYLEQGKREGCDKGHKCRNRWPWYSVPMQPPPDAFLTYMSGERARLVFNNAEANSTNTIHNVFFRKELSRLMRHATVVSFYSSLASLSTELIGRAYGGGVLKLELNEARRVLLPRPTSVPDRLRAKIAAMLNSLDKAARTDDDGIYETIDELVLRESLGLSRRDADALCTERARLATRRLKRLR